MSLRVKTLGPSKLNPITSETQTRVSREATPSLLNRVGFDLKVFNLKGLRLLRKEVIQPQVPLRLPCYDFTPVTEHSLGTCLPCGLAQPLLEQSSPIVLPAVCNKPGNGFTAAMLVSQYLRFR